MLTVQAITSRWHASSRRFRFRQFIDPLLNSGIEVVERIGLDWQWLSSDRPLLDKPVRASRLAWRLLGSLPAIVGSRECNVSWLQRTLLGPYPSLEGLIKRPLVLDVDDSIWAFRPFGEASARNGAKHADVVVAGSNHVADWFSSLHHRVELVPTSIDTQRFPFRERSEEPAHFTLGWTGSRGSLPFLEALDQALGSFLKDHPTARLRVISDHPPNLPSIPSRQFEFVNWSPISEVESLLSMDVGLMPLTDDDVSRGKCAFKMLQYMATGAPAIVSPVGACRDVARKADVAWTAGSTNEWRDAFHDAFQSPRRRIEMGRRSRKLVEVEYSVKASTSKLARIFRSLV